MVMSNKAVFNVANASATLAVVNQMICSATQAFKGPGQVRPAGGKHPVRLSGGCAAADCPWS